MGGLLYVVATPIGNLGDITLRAVEVLKSVELVLAEDTRRTKGLLSHLGISCRVASCYGEKEGQRIPRVLEILEAGEDVALLSDAGTPTLSDPGSLLVSRVWEAGFRVVPIPGPSALLAALMASGLGPGPFTFWGFPPRKTGELASFLKRHKGRSEKSVFYQAPGRLLVTLQVMLEYWGDRYAVVARELTKVHEEFIRGNLSSLVEHFSENPPRGELVLVVEGAGSREEKVGGIDEREMLHRLMEGGFSVRDAARALGILFAIPRDRVYKMAQSQKED